MPDPRSLDPQRTVDSAPASDDPSTVDATGAWRSTPLNRRLPDPPAEAPTIPGYAVTGEIARGGMGRVYSAMDLSLDREVAIKTLLPGADSNRFVTESKIAAKLPHPGVPPVHAIGVLEDGSPYLVMKFIRGRTLADILQDRSSPAEDLPRFVQIFEQIAQAVGFAHEQGVIHRDLKPLNVMVGAFGEVQVMDWGLAKDLASPGRRFEDGGATQNLMNTFVGTVMGTPGYMSPEQARGEPADARSDVFALGAILAAILTGKPAFVGSTAMETIDKSAHADLSDVHARLHACGADPELVALAKRCLAANADDRLPNGGAVARATAAYRANVERRLLRAETEAAEARVREAEQKKRRRVLLSSAAALTFVLAVGLAISLWQMNRAISAEIQASTERDAKGTALESEKAARASERQVRDRALAALRSLTDEIVENQMVRGATLTDENKEFLRTIIGQYEGLASITADDAESRTIRAEGLARVGLMRQRLAELKEADAAYTDALTLYRGLAADFPAKPDYRSQIATIQNRRGILLHATGRIEDAESTFKEALELCKRLTDEVPSQAEFQHKLALSQINLGALFHSTGRLAPAEKSWNDSLAIHERLAAQDPTKREYRERLGDGYYNLGLALRDTGRLKESSEAIGKALAVRKKLRADFPTRPAFGLQLALTQKYVGAIAHDLGRLQDAAAAFSDALQICKQLAADFPAAPEFREKLADCSFHLGGVLRELNRNDEAETAWKDAEAIQSRLVVDFPQRAEFRQQLALTYYHQGGYLYAMHRTELSEKRLRQAVEMDRWLVEKFPSRPDFHDQYANSQNQLGSLLQDVGRLDEALAVFSSALTTRRRLANAFPAKPAFRRQLAMSQHSMSSILAMLNRLKESEDALRETIAIQTRLAKDFPSQPELRQELATSLHSLGVLLREAGRFGDAEKALDESIRLFDRLAGEFPNRSVFRRLSSLAMLNLGALMKKTKRWKEAERVMARSLAIRTKLAGEFPNQPELNNDVAVALVNLVGVCNERREFRASRSYLEDARKSIDLLATAADLQSRANFREALSVAAATSAGLLEEALAMESARRIRDLRWDPPKDAYFAAIALARCLSVAAAHDDAAKRKSAAQAYGDEAMSTLQEAVRRGFADVKRFQNDADLAPLREREDFKKLVAELEAKSQTPAEKK